MCLYPEADLRSRKNNGKENLFPYPRKGVKSVSYTHLDVYMRQRLDEAAVGRSLYRILREFDDENLEDVYKRHVQMSNIRFFM